jgi:F-type H+-transporting ATPase subunit b
MIIDATFWVAVSFFLFVAGLIYLKVPQKINNALAGQIGEIKKELDEAEKLKVEAKNLLSKYEDDIDKSQRETKKIILEAKKKSEKAILEKTEKFHLSMENKKKSIEIKIIQMKNNAIKEIRNASVKVTMDSVKDLINNSIDKSKLEVFYTESLDRTKNVLKDTRS